MPKRERSAAQEAAEMIDAIAASSAVPDEWRNLANRLRAEHKERVRIDNVILRANTEADALDTFKLLSKEVKRIERRRAKR